MIPPPPRPPLFPYTTLFRTHFPALQNGERPQSPRLERQHRECGDLARERLGRRDADLRPGVEIDAAIHLPRDRSEEHTSELQSLTNLVCRLLLEKKKKKKLH